MPTERDQQCRPVLTKDRLALGAINSTHVWVLGIVAAKPDFPYPLEKAQFIEDRPFLAAARTYQESPIWDWAGELLARA